MRMRARAAPPRQGDEDEGEASMAGNEDEGKAGRPPEDEDEGAVARAGEMRTRAHHASRRRGRAACVGAERDEGEAGRPSEDKDEGAATRAGETRMRAHRTSRIRGRAVVSEPRGMRARPVSRRRTRTWAPPRAPGR